MRNEATLETLFPSSDNSSCVKTLKVVSIDEGLEQTFWNHVNRDPLDYYFFILDLKERRDKTKILLAVENGKVEGLMLIYADCIVQLRGTRKAVERLLDSVDLEQAELQAPLDCEDLVNTKYQPLIRYELILMRLQRGEENIHITHQPVRLGIDDTDQVAQIMREADPEWWGDVTAEQQKERIESTFFLGIKRDNRLVSLGNTRFEELGSNIGVIATDKNHRGLGYATSIVSALTQEILKRSSTALIHVVSKNELAKHVYTKVGFKPYKHYLLVRAERKE
jgi:ribosomal protein S18 acetylase RimI-like enzyme